MCHNAFQCVTDVGKIRKKPFTQGQTEKSELSCVICVLPNSFVLVWVLFMQNYTFNSSSTFVGVYWCIAYIRVSMFVLVSSLFSSTDLMLDAWVQG